ncbi:MAG: S-layer homology domain-containing protein [Clostridiales bacterium]|nr:S-layer homology domain-containing protein [Clostridiales bacterium]
MKKHIKLRGLLPIFLACISGLFLLFNIIVGASMPLPASGYPWAGVDFEVLLDGDSYIFYGEYEVPLATLDWYDPDPITATWDDHNPVLYKVMGEEDDEGLLTLMSNYPVSLQPYSSPSVREHYDNSYIRNWLNNDFLNAAFSAGEQEAIITTDILTGLYGWLCDIEVTGSVPMGGRTGVAATYPLKTKDKIYLPWAFGYIGRNLYWSAGNTAAEEYLAAYKPVYFKNSTAHAIYIRLRTPAVAEYTHDFVQLVSAFMGGIRYPRPFSGNDGITPLFKLNPEKIVFASPIVSTDPGFHQLHENVAYPAPKTGTAYKLTVLDIDLSSAAGSIFLGADTVATGDTLPADSSGHLVLGMEVDDPEADYSIRYKIVGSDNTLLGYGGKTDPLADGGNSFTVDAFDLDGEALDEGTYDVYVWLQKDNETTSFTASTPHYFKIEVGEISDSPPVLSDGTASRSSDSAAMIKFTSDKAGNYFYQVLPPTDSAPSVTEIKASGGAGAAMSDGENTINLSALSNGEQKIYIVGEDMAGYSDILIITIPAYSAPPSPPVLSSGTATRSSDSAAVVKFTGNKAGTYYYQVLPSTDPAPGAAGIKAADGVGAAMSSGENTINLSALSSGEKKIYIVGEDTAGDSNVLPITIGAYTSGSTGTPGGTVSTFTVKFDTNGGSTIADIKVSSGNKVSKPSNPSSIGYIFEGWFTDSGLSKEYDFNKAVTANITLYAKWEEVYSVCISFDEFWQKPYINGYPDGTFKADHSISRAEMATILYNLLARGQLSSLDGLAEFSDINSTYWAATALAWAVGEGHFKGYGDGTLRPNASTTRAELAAVLHRVDILSPVTTTNASFNDVLGHWANNEIMQLAFRGIIQGYNDGSFGPQKQITRAEAVAMVSRLFGRSDQYNTGKCFSDLEAGHWAYTYIMNAANGN